MGFPTELYWEAGAVVVPEEAGARAGEPFDWLRRSSSMFQRMPP